MNARHAGIAGLALLLLIVFAPNLVWWQEAGVAGGEATPLAASLAFIVLVFAMASRVWLGAALLLPFAALSPLESYYIHAYGHPSDSHLFGILSETDYAEAGAFVGTAKWPALALVLGILVLGVLLVLALRRQGWRWEGRSRVWILVAGVFAGALLGVQELHPAHAEDGATEQSSEWNEMLQAGEASSGVARDLAAAYPLGLPFRVAAYLEQRAGIERSLDKLRHFRFGARQTASHGERQIHVLIIGETGRPDRWQLNGYSRPTTPRLAAISGVVSFNNVTSSWAWTRMSVPVLLTRKPERDSNVFFGEKSLIWAFREAGFRTYWFSMQSPLGKHDSSIALHAHEAHETRFINPSNYRGTGVHDGALLAPLDEALARDESRQLIVLHTLGSHYNYADRYPEAFDVFRPSLKGVPTPSLHDRGQRTEMNNSYDNSVRYTDHVVAEVIQRLQMTGAQATLLYIADHGENLFDGACEKSGHGHATERDFRVPSVWWNSPAYANAWPDKVAMIGARRSAPVSSSHVFYTVLEAAHISFPGMDHTASLLNEGWRQSPRWTQTGLDFDAASRDPVCQTLGPTVSRSGAAVHTGTKG